MSQQENIDLVSTGPGQETAQIVVPGDTKAKITAGVDDKKDTTVFVDDQVTVTRDETNNKSVSKKLTDFFESQEVEENILQYLQRPIVVSRGNFSTTDTFSVFNSVSCPYTFLQSAEGLIWKNKLSGFFGIRCDMRFRIVVNANKFQQGRYIVGWTPLGGSYATTSNLKNATFNQAHNATLVQRTTVHHVELDLATDTSAELLVPFTSAYAFYSLNSIWSSVDRESLGYINVYPYSVLATPEGSTTAGYTLYVSLENVSLYGATSPQAGISFNMATGNKGVSASEVGNKGQGPVSSVAHSIASGFKEFSNIPLLGSYAKDISWIADRIGVTASIFGFSKPIAGDNAPKQQLVNAPNHTTVDGDSDARSLGFLSQPGTVPVPGISGTDLDEMDFSFIKSKPAWFLTSTWTTSNVALDLISNISVRPSQGIVTTAQPSGTASSYVPVAFLSTFFKFWRGSLVFRFKIVKTTFHSGRLQFAFYPSDEAALTGVDTYVNRVIVDIREHNEIELIIPFICKRPYLPVGSPCGSLRVTVVDPLVAPTTVSSSVSILTEMYGGHDFEVSVPGAYDATPTSFAPQGMVFEPQGGDENVNNIISMTIGNSKVTSDPHAMASICIGDKISSIRAMLKKFIPLREVSSGAPGMSGIAVRIVPDFVHNIKPDYAGSTAVNIADMVSLWASCYTLMSGGIRIRDNLDYGLIATALTTNQVHTSITAALITSGVSDSSNMLVNITPTPITKNANYVMQDTSTNNTITLEVPQYTSTLSRCIADLTAYQGNTMASYDNYLAAGAVGPGYINIYSRDSVGATANATHTFHNLSRAAADDFNLYCFISVPPMMTWADPVVPSRL